MIVIVSGHVPHAAELVVDVLAVLRRVRANARANAELGIVDEFGPFVILEAGTEAVAIYKTTDRIAIPSRAMRVEFTAATWVVPLDIDLGEVADTGNLNVVLSLDEVNASQSPGGMTRAP